MAKWNSAKIITFLNIYQTYPMLYDKKDPDYSNREGREKAVQDIIEKLGQNGKYVNSILIKFYLIHTKLAIIFFR